MFLNAKMVFINAHKMYQFLIDTWGHEKKNQVNTTRCLIIESKNCIVQSFCFLDNDEVDLNMYFVR